ncbi:MAG TPA: hypothetical protein VHP33_24290 [Polyangiaceae bacterium]|nr:hypothetical protein [Polyangiaceae bacterium]
MRTSSWCICGLALLVFGCGSDAKPNAKAAGGANAGAGGSNGTAGSSTGGGGKSSGSAGNNGSSGATGSAGMRNNPKPPLPQVAACDNLPAPGVFEEITPEVVRQGIGTKMSDGQTKGGTFAMAVDQVNQGTAYAGTLFQGLWKTTDCGATWNVIATGKNAEEVNTGMNWTLFIDPVDPNILYTNSGYGSNGLFKSTDGGVNWTDIWSRESQPELAKAFTYNFANVVAIDPFDHLHVLLTFHEPCLAPHPDTCIVETNDGGSTWRILDGEPSWNGSEGQVIFFMESSDAWLWGSQNSGFWRSEDAGKSWTEIKDMTTSHLQSSQLLRTKAGAFYMAAADGIWTSSDGKVPNWKLIPDTGPIVGGLVSDGTNMYASTCYFPDFCDDARYLTSPETDGQTWTEMKHPKMSQGGNLGIDKAHKLLFSSNLDAGLWRVVVP